MAEHKLVPLHAVGAHVQVKARASQVKLKDAGIAEQKHARVIINGVPVQDRVYAHQDNLKHNHAGIAELKQEHARHHASGPAMERAPAQARARRGRQILQDAQPAKQKRARIIAIGAPAQAQANALRARPNV